MGVCNYAIHGVVECILGHVPVYSSNIHYSINLNNIFYVYILKVSSALSLNEVSQK